VARCAADTDRLFSCARCQRLAGVCRACDFGNRYCSTACKQIARRVSQRRSAAIYQRTRSGALRHAERMQRVRNKRRRANFSAQKVTHHSVTLRAQEATTGASAMAARSPPAGGEEAPSHDVSILDEHAAGDGVRREAARDDARLGRPGSCAPAAAPEPPAGALDSARGLGAMARRPNSSCGGCGRPLSEWAFVGPFGDELWPAESPLVHFEVAHRGRRAPRLRGNGDFRALYRAQGAS